jgi:hypothetical protein
VTTPSVGQNRLELTHRLELLNAALARLGVDPLVSVGESLALPVDDLRGVVKSTADRVEAVGRALRGIA